MTATGNGTPQRCVANLIRTIRGEVPYERIKGIDPTLIDRPSKAASPQVAADVAFVLRTYEPRVNTNDIDIVALADQAGSFGINVDVTINS